MPLHRKRGVSELSLSAVSSIALAWSKGKEAASGDRGIRRQRLTRITGKSLRHIKRR